MSATLKTACIQFTAGPDIEDNLNTLEEMVRAAAAKGAQFIATPENSCHIRSPQSAKLKSARGETDNLALNYYASWAAELKIWLLIGSISVKLDNGKLANRSYLFNDQGNIVARYDKIHLFDVDLPTGESHRESDLFEAGKNATLAKTPWGGLGMTICYDVRFPHLYRKLAKDGAKIITVPAAFTVPTGQAHWEILLRSRAIETGAYIIAPAQCGEHEGGRHTYGHSLIIDPWGNVIAEADDQPAIVYAELDLDKVAQTRQAIPALTHDRPI
jgi:predicted amidohydrolase